MIGIVVALFEEAKGSIEKIKNLKTLKLSGKDVYSGTIDGKEIALIVSNIGKVNAAVCTQLLIDKFHPSVIINFGSAGGINGKVNVLGYYAAEKCCQYDFDLSLIDDVKVGYIQGFDDVYFKVDTRPTDFLPKISVASSDHFTASENDVDTVNSMSCYAFDMELGAIGQVCTLNSVPLVSFKGITDVHGSGADGDTFKTNLATVCNGFYDVLVRVLKNV